MIKGGIFIAIGGNECSQCLKTAFCLTVAHTTKGGKTNIPHSRLIIPHPYFLPECIVIKWIIRIFAQQ